MAAAILDLRSATTPRIVPSKGNTIDFVRLFGLDDLLLSRWLLVCRWRRDAEGRLACHWEAAAARPLVR